MIAKAELTNEQLARASMAGCKQSRDLLVTQNQGLAYRVAKRVGRSCPILSEEEDLVQSGLLGMVKASQTYDPAKGAAWSNFASVAVKRDVYRARQYAGIVKMPAWGKARTPAITEAVEKVGRPASLDRLASKRTHKSQKFDVADAASSESIEAVDAADEVATKMKSVERWMETWLNENERLVVKMRFGLGCERQSLRKIAPLVGLTKARVQQIEKEALGILRAAAGIDDEAGEARCSPAAPAAPPPAPATTFGGER